jgi:hypothetical protein
MSIEHYFCYIHDKNNFTSNKVVGTKVGTGKLGLIGRKFRLLKEIKAIMGRIRKF